MLFELMFRILIENNATIIYLEYFVQKLCTSDVLDNVLYNKVGIEEIVTGRGIKK